MACARNARMEIACVQEACLAVRNCTEHLQLYTVSSLLRTMVFQREIAPRLGALFTPYPFATVTVPRQSGETALCSSAIPDLAYVDLEAPDQRKSAESDTRGLLARLDGGAERQARAPGNAVPFCNSVPAQSNALKWSRRLENLHVGASGKRRLCCISLGEKPSRYALVCALRSVRLVVSTLPNSMASMRRVAPMRAASEASAGPATAVSSANVSSSAMLT